VGQLADQRRADQETDGQRREYAENGAQRQVTEDVNAEMSRASQSKKE